MAAEAIERSALGFYPVGGAEGEHDPCPAVADAAELDAGAVDGNVERSAEGGSSVVVGEKAGEGELCLEDGKGSGVGDASNGECCEETGEVVEEKAAAGDGEEGVVGEGCRAVVIGGSAEIEMPMQASDVRNGECCEENREELVKEKAVAGDQEVVGNGGDVGLGLENGYGHAKDVVLNDISDMGKERERNGELCLKFGNKEPGIDDLSDGECRKENRELVAGGEEGGVEKGGNMGISLENGHDRAEGVVLTGNSETELLPQVDLGQEKVRNGELFSKGDHKDSNGSSNGECCEDNEELREEKRSGEPNSDKEKRELPLENGHVHQEHIVAEVETTDEAEEKLEHTHEEFASTAEDEEKLDTEIAISEISCEAEFNSALKVDEYQDSEALVTELKHQDALGSTVEEKHELEAGVAETSQQTSARIEEEQKSEDESFVSSQPSEPAPAVAEKVVPKVTVGEANQEAELESAPKVVEEQNSEAVVAKTDQQSETSRQNSGRIEEEQKPETIALASPQQSEPEPAIAEKEVTKAALGEAGQEAELESSAPGIAEELDPETVVAETDQQSETIQHTSGIKNEEQNSEIKASVSHQQSGPEPVIAEKLVPEAIVGEVNGESELESAPKVLEEQHSEMGDTETDHQSEPISSVAGKKESVTTLAEGKQEAEPAPMVVEEQKSETAVIGTDQQRESESSVAEKQEPKVTVAEGRQQSELESDPKVEEQQKSEIVDTDTDQQSEQDLSANIEEKEDVGPESAVQKEGKDQPGVEAAGMDVKDELETVEIGAKQVVQAAVTELAELESTKTVEEQHACIAREAHDHQRSDSVVHVEDQLEMGNSVTKVNCHEESKPVVEIDERGQPDITVKEIDGQEELKSTIDVTGQHPEILVSAIEVIVEEENLDPEAAVYEPSDHLGTISDVKAGSTLEKDDNNGSSKTDEPVSISHIDGLQPPTYLLESCGHETVDHVNMHVESEVAISPLECSNSPRLNNVDGKEVLNENSAGREIQVVNSLCLSKASNDTTHEDDVCESIGDLEKKLDDEHDDEMKPENDMKDVEYTASSVERDQDMHKHADEEHTHMEVEATAAILTPPEEPAVLPLDGERSGTHAVKRQPCYIIRVPRFSDDGIRTKLQHARLQLDEKTQRRDSIRVEMQKQEATLSEYQEKLDAAKAEERAARAAVSAKCQEIDSIQSMINKMKKASSVDEINDKIHKLEHTMQHESITLPLEKKYIQEIKRLRHNRAELSANMAPEAEIQDVFDRRDQIEEQFKTLKKELDPLRAAVLKVENNVRIAWKKCNDEFHLLRELQEQFRVANYHRQEAYIHMQNLRNELKVKNGYFNMYRDDQNTALNYVSARDKDGLQSHCSKQVEKVMQLWNKDEEFRKEYVKSNMYSTIRRLRSLDGRSLGPDEDPPVLRSYVGRSSRNAPLSLPVDGSSRNTPSSLPNATIPVPVLDLEMNEQNLAIMAAPEQAQQTNQPSKSNKSATSKGNVKAMVSNTEEVEQAEKERKRTKEEEESARKAEELARKDEESRKEQAAAKLKEQNRLEQIAKAKEAEERKRRNAEKAQARAEYRAQKEAELKEKKRAKKKKAGSTDTTKGVDGDGSPTVDDIPTKTAKEPETADKTPPRRPSRPQLVVKQYNKIQPLPLPLRNRGRRKMQTWMWVLLTCLLVFVLFLAGNYISFSNLSQPNSGY